MNLLSCLGLIHCCVCEKVRRARGSRNRCCAVCQGRIADWHADSGDVVTTELEGR